MKVAVVVLNWNKSALTLRAVHSLLASVAKAHLWVVVVDNHSAESDRQALEMGLPAEVLYIPSKENLGYAAGNRLGVDWALQQGADAIWILNNDACVRPDTLSLLLQGVERWKGPAIFSHTTLMSENPDRIHYSGSYGPEESPDPGFPYDRRKGELLADCKNALKDKAATIFGHSLFIPTGIIQAHGFMDPDFFLYFEETEYLWRLRRQGVETVYLAEPICVHESTASKKDASGAVDAEIERVLKYYYERNQWYFLKLLGKVKREQMVRQAGGIGALALYFIRNFKPPKPEQARTLYYQNLAMWHAWWGVRGRRVEMPLPQGQNLAKKWGDN